MSLNKVKRNMRHILHEVVVKIFPKSIRKRYFLSCQEASLMLEEKSQLNLLQQLKLNFHLFICQCCTDYKSQIMIITQYSKKLTQIKLTDKQKDKILSSQKKVIKKINSNQ